MAIETLRPNGAGDRTKLCCQIPDSGAHWEKVDEAIADDSTTYVYGSTKNVADLYLLPASSGSGTISKITVYMRGHTESIPKVTILIKTHSTEYLGAEVAAEAGWHDVNTEWTTNPNTGSAWTWDEIDALQIGVKLISWQVDGASCTQVYVEVDYTETSTSIKTVMGVPIADIKTINGVPIADVKSWLGISNVD